MAKCLLEPHWTQMQYIRKPVILSCFFFRPSRFEPCWFVLLTLKIPLYLRPHAQILGVSRAFLQFVSIERKVQNWSLGFFLSFFSLYFCILLYLNNTLSHTNGCVTSRNCLKVIDILWIGYNYNYIQSIKYHYFQTNDKNSLIRTYVMPGTLLAVFRHINQQRAKLTCSNLRTSMVKSYGVPILTFCMQQMTFWNIFLTLPRK